MLLCANACFITVVRVISPAAGLTTAPVSPHRGDGVMMSLRSSRQNPMAVSPSLVPNHKMADVSWMLYRIVGDKSTPSKGDNSPNRRNGAVNKKGMPLMTSPIC